MDGYSAYRTIQLAEVYDASYADRSDSSFWLSVAAAAGDGPILELACGTGQVLIPLAEAGHEVIGMDLSGAMLDACRTRLAALPEPVSRRVSLLEADMTAFDLGRTVPAILCAFNSFHHLRTVPQQLACLERCREHLDPQGLLVLDLFNPDPAPAPSESPDAPDPTAVSTVEWTEGRTIRRWMSRCDYDRVAQCNECEMTYEIIEADHSTTRLTETFPLRLIYRYELEHLLARAGFRMLALYGDYDRSPFTGESFGMIVVAVPQG